MRLQNAHVALVAVQIPHRPPPPHTPDSVVVYSTTTTTPSTSMFLRSRLKLTKQLSTATLVIENQKN